jgi:uncharacterized membrane protein
VRGRARHPALVPGDAVRAAAALSVVVGLVGFGPVVAAVFFLALGGAVLARALAAPRALDVACGATTLVAAWAAALDWYRAVGWLDLAVHLVATGLIAVLAHLALVRVGVAPSPATANVADVADVVPRHRPRLGAGVVTGAVGVALATLWELGEWFGNTVLDDRIQVGGADTVSDLAAGTVGAVVAGVLVARGVLLPRGRR